MKKNHKFLILIIYSVLFSNCHSNKFTNSEIINIQLKEDLRILKMSTFLKKVDYVQFKFENGVIPIGTIKELRIIENEIIIKEYIGTHSLLKRFSYDGTFLNEIGKLGRGAKEIINPRDIAVFKNHFVVWDNRGVHSFKKNGEYLEYLFNAQNAGSRFLFYKNYFYFFNELGYPGFVSKFSPSGNLIKVFLPYKKNYFGNLDYSSIIQFNEDSIHFFSPLIDTIYFFKDDRIFPKYSVKFSSNKSFNQVMLKNENKNPLQFLKILNEIKPSFVNIYLENNNYIFLNYTIKVRKYNLLIKKSNWKRIYFSNLTNDIDQGIWSVPIFLTDADELIIPIYPNDILNSKNFINNKILEKIGENSNPILMICKLKY